MAIIGKSFASVSLLVALSIPAFGQKLPFVGKKSDPAKEAEKNVLRYEKLKQYSLDRYRENLEFRDEVDQRYEELLRSHSQRAYARNTGVSSYIATVREDRWRVHENLYDNLVVQDHINRLGQHLVPKDSERAFAFKVIPEPIPLAETLSTGTIYISTGLISVVDSEAQLAYVLAHEMAHVQLDHWKERVMLDCGQQAYAEDQAAKSARIGMFTSLLGAGLGGIFGGIPGTGIAGNLNSAVNGMALGGAIGQFAGALLNRPLIVSWDQVEEDAADQMAFKAVLEASYDVREVPTLYATMQKAAARDTRIGLGFLGSRHRIEQRMEKAKDLIANAYQADIAAKLKTGFLSTTAEHRNLMAELKRDNGIMAYYNDMFEMSRSNLADAVAIRDNDPAAHYFYAKVLKLIGRTVEDDRLAQAEFYKATKFDTRDENFGSHLHLALMMARDRNADKAEITKELDSYVSDYAHYNVMDRALRAFPPNLDSVYEYMTLYGDPGWRPKPPDLKDVDPAYQQISDGVAARVPGAPQGPAMRADNPAEPGKGTTGVGGRPPVPAELMNRIPGGQIIAPVQQMKDSVQQQTQQIKKQ